MNKFITCIICPKGCEMQVAVKENTAVDFCGNSCPKGIEYARSEIENPVRNFATSVRVHGGDLPLCSVRLTNPIPKSRIADALNEIKTITLSAPVAVGQTLIKNILGLDSDVIATREINIK